MLRLTPACFCTVPECPTKFPIKGKAARIEPDPSSAISVNRRLKVFPERFHGSIKGECIRPGTPMPLEDAQRIVGNYVEHYYRVRLHNAIGYVARADKLAGRGEIFAARDRKLTDSRGSPTRRVAP